MGSSFVGGKQLNITDWSLLEKRRPLPLCLGQMGGRQKAYGSRLAPASWPLQHLGQIGEFGWI